MAESTLARAKAGDSDAFEALISPYRRELEVHCYRMLGSVQDAEEAAQDTLLSAWRALNRFEGASLRALAVSDRHEPLPQPPARYLSSSEGRQVA